MAEQSWKDWFTAPPNVPRPMSDDPESPYFTLPPGVKLVPVEHNPYDLEAAKTNLPKGPLTMGPGEGPFWQRLVKGQVGPSMTDMVGSAAGTALDIPQYTKDVLTGQLDPTSPEGIRRAADIGMLLGAGGATNFAMRGASAEPGAFGLFYGQKAKLEPGNGGFLRKQMDEALGRPEPSEYTPGQIFRGPDGKLRYESPDTGSFLVADDIVPGSTHKLGEIFDHPTLYQAYPELAHTKVSFEQLPSGTLGYFDPQTKTLGLNNEFVFNRDWENLHSVLLHEIQHQIQEKEGFVGGANPQHPAIKQAILESPETKEYVQAELAMNRFRSELQKKAGQPDISSYLGRNPDMHSIYLDLEKRLDAAVVKLKALPHQLYESVGGEVESRNVQYRWLNDSYNVHPLRGDPKAPTAAYPNPLAIDHTAGTLVPAKDWKP